MHAHDVPYEIPRELTGGGFCSQGSDVDKGSEAANDDPSVIEPLRWREGSNKVHGDVVPWNTGYRKGM